MGIYHKLDEKAAHGRGQYCGNRRRCPNGNREEKSVEGTARPPGPQVRSTVTMEKDPTRPMVSRTGTAKWQRWKL